MSENVYSAPRLVGTMTESPDYQVLGSGLTDRIFLLGHATSTNLNDPIQVVSMQDAVNRLGADATSPLLRSLIEAYYAGARDLWIISAAPMDEYVDPASDRTTAGTGRGTGVWGEAEGELQIATQFAAANASRFERDAEPLDVPSESDWDNYNFYERYYARLQVSYELIVAWELAQILVPVEALFFDAGGVDFLTQISQHCADSLSITGSVRLGILGTRTSSAADFSQAIADMASDGRMALQGDAGKFVSVIVGEGTFNLKELPTIYSGPLGAVAAGMLSTLPLNRNWIYKPLLNVLSVVGPDLTAGQVTSLAEAKLNPVIRTARGVRGQPFQTVILTDNTVGTTGTDYWSMIQTRLVLHVIEQVRSLSNRYIGTIEFGEYKRSVNNYLYGLAIQNVIRGFDVNIVRDTVDRTSILVDISVQPFFALRQLSFSTVVGPGL